MSATWIRVVVETDGDGEEHVIGQALVTIDNEETDPGKDAVLFLKAWDEARDAAERTLRLYGSEGLWRALRVRDGKETQG